MLFSGDVRYAFSLDSSAVDSPSDHIAIEDLHVFKDKAVIDTDNLIWARVLDTHSMEPVLNANSVSLELLPSTFSDISVGDVISYSHNLKVIIHRVILISEDSAGWYCVTKGDNNKEADDYKVRFSDVKGVLVGVLY
ncbi:signal peptidase I [Candidatus Woesearchaeota archaeon]|nr:signal peptidase I [Candidatus Woesearchaeota archaeon]